MTEDLLAATDRASSERVSAVQWRQLASSHLHPLQCEDRPCRRRRFKNRVLYDLSIHNNRNRQEAKLMRFE